MSKNANRYAGTPESRDVKRAKGKTITKNATQMLGKGSVKNSRSVKSKPHKTPQLFSYIKDLAAQAEIFRRVDVIRAEVVRQILAPGGHPLLGGDFITYINLLVQLPVLVFLYKKEGRRFIYRQHFDFEKFKFSRGSLRLVERLGSQTATEMKDVELTDLEANESNRKKLFRVFNTDFYIRCFLLDTRKDDQPFFAVTADVESSLNVHYEYVRVGLQNLLDQDAQDFAFYSDSFRNAIFNRIGKILEDFIYVQPSFDRGKKTLNVAQTSSELEVLNYFANGRRASYKKEGLYKDFSERLNNSIEDAAFSASMLKKNGVNSSRSLGKDVPNMFLMLRAYGRNSRRAAIDGVFRGYAYNTRFNISISQREKIENFLKKLVALGKDGYQKLGGKQNELYGGYKNDKMLLWDFGGGKDKERDAGYRNFAESLDNWFWRNLQSVDFLIRAFLSPIGSQSVSIVDPVFYYGASIYRMPFRRLGGLERLKGLSELYDQLGVTEKKNFSFEMLENVSDVAKRNELKKDCVRVVVFYYLTRLLADSDGNQAELDTKVHLYPIDVGGVVVGAVGKASYDFKPEKRRPESLKLPTTRQTWDEEVMFLSSVVLPIRASLRRQYRGLQIEYLVNQFHMELARIVGSSSDLPAVDFDTVIKNFESLLNRASLSISRVCPYPAVTFSFQTAAEPTIDSEDRRVVSLGDVKLVIKQDESPSIFRFLTRQEKRMAYDVSRPLALRFWESARYLLPQGA